VITLRTSGVRSLEAAGQLGIDGADVYRMLFPGELDGGPGRDGMVYFDEASIEAYLERHGSGVVAEPSTGSTGTSSDESTPASAQKSRKRSSDAPNDTQENGPSSASDHS
jgi:hypothetical protein